MTMTDDRPQEQTAAGDAAKRVAKTTAKKGSKSAAKWVLGILGFKVIVIGVAILLALVVIAAAAGAAKQAATAPTPGTPTIGGGAHAAFDPGNMFSDAVFYNAATMTAAQIQAYIDSKGCTDSGCIGKVTYGWPGANDPWCKPVPAGAGSFPVMLSAVTTACGFNPQVALIMITKESQGLTRSPVPNALTGFGCPDTGPGGSASCDPAKSGVWEQTYGMAQAFAHLRQDSARVSRYIEGATHDVFWNVEESGCGTTPVTVQNRATASILTYTPYVPDQASIDAYPGTGDACSSYGNRNLFFGFQKDFGDTGGGKASPNVALVAANGPNVTIPNNQYVTPAAAGKTITAPNAGVGKGLAAGFGALGLPYVWGGGDNGGGPTNGCSRGGGALNSCGTAIGFDCSGLTAYVLVQGGFPSPGGNSGEQRNPAHGVPWAQGQPGDIIGFPGHVAVYLGVIDGKPYILEASDVGIPIHVVPLTRADHDPVMYRYWSGQ